MFQFPYVVTALRVVQPIGVFYVAVLPASLLLQVAASDVMSATLSPQGGYTLTGTQRALKENRVGPIAAYIERVDAAFPNSIILAANYNAKTGYDEDESYSIDQEQNGDTDIVKQNPAEWSVSQRAPGEYQLTIPSAKRLAAIIDGQHRLFAFTKVENKDRLGMQLICSIFLELPKQYQAQLFATINSTQKQVDRSLTFELFGYNISEEKEPFWTPDKLAVFLTRKLATDDLSPLKGRIIVSPKRDSALDAIVSDDWRVSTAVVVDGIMRLISSNPKRDSNNMFSAPAPKSRAVLIEYSKDRAPLRNAFVNSEDLAVFTLVRAYLDACKNLFWDKAKTGSFIVKTVGVQAQFDILRLIAAGAYDTKNASVQYFEEKLQGAADIDFSDIQFKNASGSGRTMIRKTIAAAIGI